MSRDIYIRKQSGEVEPFSEAKLRRSLKRSGSSNAIADTIVAEVRKILRPGITTDEIYSYAFDLLKNVRNPIAARYNLRRGIMELGPSGFPFEQYLAQLLERVGYSTKTNQIMRGACITHEIDIIAEKGKSSTAIIEAKFHSGSGQKTSVKDALYTYARFLDIQTGWVAKYKTKDTIKQGRGKLESWLATNTKVTTEVKKYARCVGMTIMSWSYPKELSLQKLVEDQSLYPVTVLTTLKKGQVKKLLEHNIVLCEQLAHDEKLLGIASVSRQQAIRVLDEVHALCP